MIGVRKASWRGRFLATLCALAVFVVTAASQDDTGNSTGGCINVYPEINKTQPYPGIVQIEWRPVPLTSVTGYLVEYTSHCDNRRNTTQVGNVNTTIIEGLYSYSNYTLRMTVVCNSTISPTFSPTHTFTTPSERVMVAPENVTVETLNTTTLVVRWQALDPCDWSGEPEGYVITVTDLTSGRVVRENVSWDHQTVHLVIGSGRRYNVSVSAVNSEGEGPPSIPVTSPVDDEPCTEFFCSFYWYYVIGVGGAVLIAIAIACVAFACKMCCRRKVSYAQDNESKRFAFSSSFQHPPQLRGSGVDLDDIESMTDPNSEITSRQGDFPPCEDPCDETRIYNVLYEQVPPHPHVAMQLRSPADWTHPQSYSARLGDTQYATLQSVNGSLNSQSQELSSEPSTGRGVPQEMGRVHGVTPAVMSQSGAFPYEVPSRDSSEEPQSVPIFNGSPRSREHIYQSVGDSPHPVPPPCGPRPAASSASSLTMPSWPTSASNSREGSQDPQPNTLPRKGRGQAEERWSPVSEEGHFPLPPPPDHPPPPLRRSTLDLMELMREETHHSSQGVLHSRALSSPSENHHHVSSSAVQQPSSFPDLHSPTFSSDSSLANNGPTQTPPPELLVDSLWNKGGMSVQPPSYSVGAKHAQSQESQL